MKDYSELSRMKKWYKYYLIGAVVILIAAGILYWVSAPIVTVDFVLAVALFVLLISLIQSFNLVFELDQRIRRLED